jgi:3D-(3,5/4)-trihydroxycyclohexane-1,2-dione acylhydrolase (decyclizing)
MATIRLTMAQALVKYLVHQRVEIDGAERPLLGGVFAIFGHGNVAGLGEALASNRDALPTLRAHNEQAMGHAAIAFAKANRRRRMMACTTSIGPGATNLVTACATAYVNRLPLLLLPGDVFASRTPDPVLQQIESFQDPTVTANDCLRPVSRWFDRIHRPEQILSSLPQAIRVLTDPADCGPVTLALPQDVQAEAFDYPESFFHPRLHRVRRVRPDVRELDGAVRALKRAQRPLVIAGGGVHYADAVEDLRELAVRHQLLVAETQAGKGAMPWDHRQAVGAIGVTGTSVANALAHDADLVLAVGTRLSDFTTASRTLFQSTDLTLIGLNVAGFDAVKHGAVPLVGDAKEGLRLLHEKLGAWRASDSWQSRADVLNAAWNEAVERVTSPREGSVPSDAEVLGAVNRLAGEKTVVVSAAGGLPGELHKLWRTKNAGGYHVEYGYSCMGYEIAGGLGVKMAEPDREVVVLVGDGSYLMMNSEIATSVMLGHKITIVVLDNRGFACINRLQQASGGEPFNNLLSGPDGKSPAPEIDFRAHAAALGAHAEKVGSIAELETALVRTRAVDKTSVIVIETDPAISTKEGGAWWDVAIPAESSRSRVREARRTYLEVKKKQRT